MADTSGLPPEGWYPDRPNATRLRHWTGTGWTSEFRPIEATPPERMPEPISPVHEQASPVRETTDRALSRRELRAQVGALVQGEPDTLPAAAAAAAAVVAEPQPVAEPERAPEPVRLAEPERAPEPQHAPAPVSAPVLAEPAPLRRQAWQESFTPAASSSQTLAGWLFAASPIWLGALMIAGTTLLPTINPLLVQGGAVVVGFTLTLVLVRWDISQLAARGHRAPSALWIFLPLGYFVVRMVRVGMRAAAMVVTYLASAAALVVLLYLVFVSNPVLMSLLTPSVPATSSAIPAPVVTLSAQERETLLSQAGAEAQLRLELGKTFEVGAVDCVPFPSTDPGTTTTCVAVLDGTSYNVGLEVTPDQPGTAFLLTGMLPVQN